MSVHRIHAPTLYQERMPYCKKKSVLIFWIRPCLASTLCVNIQDPGFTGQSYNSSFILIGFVFISHRRDFIGDICGYITHLGYGVNICLKIKFDKRHIRLIYMVLHSPSVKTAFGHGILTQWNLIILMGRSTVSSQVFCSQSYWCPRGCCMSFGDVLVSKPIYKTIVSVKTTIFILLKLR